MSSPFYFQEGDDSPRQLAPNPVTPFASTSANAASSHHQHLLQSVHREGRRLRTTTADSTLSQDSGQPSPFSTQTPYLYKHTNQTPRGYDPTTRPSTAPPTDSTSINTPSSFTPFLPNRNHPSAPIFDPSSPFSQPHDFGGASSSKTGGATDSFRSGGANMRARLFREGASGAGAPAPVAGGEAPMSSPGGLGAGLFTSGAGGPSVNSLGKQRQRTSSRPLDEEMHVHSSPVRVVDPREFQGGNRRSRNVGGGFGGGADDEDEEEEEDMGRELGEAEMSFVGFGVSPVKHPSIGRGEAGEWSSMGGGEETSFGGEESRMFWDEMAASESVELPFGSVRAERGRGRNMSNEKPPMGVDETEDDREDEKSRREREGSTTATTSRGSGPPPPTTMHVRNRSDDTNQMGSSPTRGPLRHQRSFHTRVRSDETTSFYQSFESAVGGAEGDDQQQPSTPPSYFVPTLATTHEPPHTSSNLSPRRQQQQQQHHQARDIPSPIAPNPNWTFPSDILAAGAGGFSRQDQDDSGAYDEQQHEEEEQQQQQLDPSRRPPSSYADQLFSQQQYQFRQQQPQQQQYDQQQYGGLETPELEQEGDNTPILEQHADRSPTFSPQIGTPDATFENSFASEGQQQQPHHQQQFQPQDHQQQQFETQQPQQQQQSLYHPVHPYPGFGFAPQQPVEQQEVFIHSQPHYIFSPPVQQQHQFAPAPAPPLPAVDESSSSQQHQLFVPRQQQQQHQDQIQVPSTFQGHPSSFRNHRRIGSFDADASPHIGYSPQLDQSPMFPGQPFVGAGGASGAGAGGEDFGLTDLLRQARVHQNESIYHHPMGLIPEQQVEEANAEGGYGLGVRESVFDGNNVASGTSSTGSAQQQRQAPYAPFPHQVEHQGRPFPSVLAPAGSNQGIGLLPAQNFPAGFHPSTSQLPQQQQAPVLPPSTTNLPVNSSRLSASFTSTTGPMANRPPNAIVGRRPITPVIPVGHDPSFNTFERGPRVAPLLDDSSYPASTLPSSGKAPSSKSSGERQVPRGFPLVIGPGTRMRPGPKAKPKGAKSSAASRMRVASEIRVGSMETEDSSTSPFAMNANALAGPSSAPASGLSLQQQQQIPPRPSSSLSNNTSTHYHHHPPPITTALLQQHQQSFAAPSLPVLKPHSHRSASSQGEEEIDPTHYSPDNDNSDEEGSVNSASNRPNITSALIESLFTTIRVASTSNNKRASAGSASGGAGGDEFGGDGAGGEGEGGGGSKRKGRKLEVRYRCLVAGCERYFPRKSAIVNHIQTHLEDKPFNCPAEGCDASFVRQHDLRRHERIHSGTKPFPCACGKGFARGDALMRHRQRGICAGSIVPRKAKGEME